MFGCGSKYFSERLKLECVYKYALRMAKEFYKSPTQNVKKKNHNSVNISRTKIILVSE